MKLLTLEDISPKEFIGQIEPEYSGICEHRINVLIHYEIPIIAKIMNEINETNIPHHFPQKSVRHTNVRWKSPIQAERMLTQRYNIIEELKKEMLNKELI